MRLRTLMFSSVAILAACSSSSSSNGSSSSGGSSGTSSTTKASSSSGGSSSGATSTSSLAGSSSGASSSTSSAAASSSSGSSSSSASGADAGSLIGTWDLTTTPIGGSAIASTVVVGQDSLTVTSPSFSFTAQRSGTTLTFNDVTDSTSDMIGTQTVASFNPGLVPFNLGGSWTLQGGPAGGSPTLSCTLQVSATEIDGSCENLGPTSPAFNFTTSKGQTGSSGFGDFGGSWTNTWYWGEPDGGSYPCSVDFAGDDVDTCDGGMAEGFAPGTPISGITFTYDGVDTVSGSAQGWAEFAATRQ